MKIELTSEELKALRKIQQKPGLHRRRYIKVTVIIMLDQGYEVKMVELALGIDDNTIYRYEKAYKKVGLKKYIEDGYIPYSGKLSEEQLTLLDEHLEENCYSDSKFICQFIEEEFDVKYTPTGLIPLLHRLGYEYKETKVVPGKADEQAQVEFLEEVLPAILEEQKAGQAVVYYSDGCHPTHNTIKSRGWIKRGKSFEIQANSGRKRVNINAAINATDSTKLVYDITKSVNAQSTQRLCQSLLKKHRKGTIYFICDNAKYNRNRVLKEWAENKRIKFIFLPPYSPNLNLIERLWGYLKQKIINSIYFEKYDDFKNEIIDFLENIKDYKSDLKSLLSLNFRTVGGTSVHSHNN